MGREILPAEGLFAPAPAASLDTAGGERCKVVSLTDAKLEDRGTVSVGDVKGCAAEATGGCVCL